MAADLGITILLEPHGPLTDSPIGTRAILDALDNADNLGINFDTGNSWLGGSDPVAYAQTFQDRIFHWKDLPAEWEEKRGKQFGCGFSPIALGDGVIDLPSIFKILQDVEYCTLEIGGDENVLKRYEYLKSLGAE
jgi:inosose dehydratase